MPVPVPVAPSRWLSRDCTVPGLRWRQLAEKETQGLSTSPWRRVLVQGSPNMAAGSVDHEGQASSSRMGAGWDAAPGCFQLDPDPAAGTNLESIQACHFFI